MLTDLSKRIHEGNKKKGFYDEKEVNIPEKLALVHSEISEALEAHRIDKFAVKYGERDIEDISEVQHDEAFKEIFLETTKDTYEDELADALIRILDLAGYGNIDIGAHVAAKLRFNSMREYKHGKNY